MSDPHVYEVKGVKKEDTRPDRYKIQVFTHSGCMIEMDKVYKDLDEASAEASTITVNGLKAVMASECMTFIPALQISSVSIEDTMKGFVPNVTITNLATVNVIASQQPAQLENKSDPTEPQSN